MNKQGRAEDLEFRVGLLERAVTESALRIRDLERSLAELEGSGEFDESLPRRPMLIGADAITPFAVGFHVQEKDGDGRSYRWTGSADFFELRLSLDRSGSWDFEMELMINEHVDMSRVRGFVDYAEIPIRIESSGQRVRGTIPARGFSGLATITFYQPSRFVPRDLDPASEDTRCLGVVFYCLKLEPANAGKPPGAHKSDTTRAFKASHGQQSI
ncbi:MAG TPA: hypothetical protein VGF97_06520 [Rhizomicrobium sp.]|jgi:hypothetical protein